jgi:hypothetical protein
LETGAARPPQNHKTADGFALGTWTHGQRQKRLSLPVEHRQFLESLEGWSWDPLADQWNKAFKRLKTYALKTGTAKPLSTYKTADGLSLGSWVVTQRMSRDSLTPERQRLLESLAGWSWDLIADQWDEAFERLKTYTLENGAARPPFHYKTADGFALGGWAYKQRSRSYSRTPQRVAQLESLEGWSWDPLADQWSQGLRILKNFSAASGHSRPSDKYKTSDGFSLGSWVTTQRMSRDSLTPERQRLLESLPGWSWDPLADQWNKAFKRLKTYALETGAARPPQNHKTADGFSLGTWSNSQRKNKDSLTRERQQLLESLAGWSWDLIADQWNEAFKRLKTYALKAGTASPPRRHETADGFALGLWTSRQRNAKKTLSSERKALLESLKGWTWEIKSSTKSKRK